MLKVVATVNNRRTLFCGLDRENTTRLHDGKPIAVDVQALLATLGPEPVQDLIIFAGETLADCRSELARYLPLPGT